MPFIVPHIIGIIFLAHSEFMEQLSFFINNEGLLFPEDLLNFYPHFLEENFSISLMDQFIHTVPWKQQEFRIYGKKILTPRLTAWYGDNNKTYKYTGTKFDPMPWTQELLELRKKVEEFTTYSFNSVLLNYYRNGNDSVAWHRDNEKELGINPVIASLSLGQARKFDFRHKENHQQKYSLELGNGSLLLMKGDLQHHWEHRIPKSTLEIGARINLTFRVITQ